MAESGTNATSRGFGKILQKSVTRTKEKVLQNLGKADKTRDDDFEQHVQNFSDQQAAAERLQKELKHYATCVKEMSMASYSMYRTIKDTYEINWTGYTEVTSSVEQMASLWEDYMLKLNDLVTYPMTTYTNSFQDLKKQIAKRGRKLTDYDSARHNHESFCTAKRHDESKTTKALDELNEARQVYETLNTRLHDELPSFYASRIGLLASLFNAMFTAEAVFEHETAKLKDIMADVTHRLSEESNREGVEVRRVGTSVTRSDSDIENHRLDNSRHGSVKNDQRQNQIARRESASAGKPASNPKGLPSSSSDVLRKGSASPPIAEVERSTVHGNSFWNHEPEPASKSQQKYIAEKSEETRDISPKETIDSNGHYSLLKPTDDIYKCPTSNQPISSLYYPDDKVLYKVVATHAYVGDDTDELSFEPGDIISVVPFDDPDEQDEGWLTGFKGTTREKGVFPENFTKRLE